MKPNQSLSLDQFRQAARDSQEPIAEARLRASFDTEVKAGEGDSRTLMFTISTASVDRMGDTIAVDGWKLDDFRRNPVCLWAHDSGSLPVAKATKVWIESAKLKMDAEFTPAGMARFNDTVFDMYKQGFLSATSVGFMPLKYAFTDDPKRRFGIDFLEQTLLEVSMVPVPANQEALIEGRSAGIDIGPVLDWCEDQMRRVGGSERVVKLAESVLGSSSGDLVALAWAERILVAGGRKLAKADEVIITRERLVGITKMEAAATRRRLAEKRARDLDRVRLGGS